MSDDLEKVLCCFEELYVSRKKWVDFLVSKFKKDSSYSRITCFRYLPQTIDLLYCTKNLTVEMLSDDDIISITGDLLEKEESFILSKTINLIIQNEYGMNENEKLSNLRSYLESYEVELRSRFKTVQVTLDSHDGIRKLCIAFPSLS